MPPSARGVGHFESSLCQDPDFRRFRARRTGRHETAQPRRLVSGPGVTSPKSRPSGCRAGHAGKSRFLVSSRTSFGVEEHLAVDGIGDLALERAKRLLLGLSLGDLVLEIDASIESRDYGSE